MQLKKKYIDLFYNKNILLYLIIELIYLLK